MVTSNGEIRKDYFLWLCSLVGIEGEDDPYILLAKTLHKKEFFWAVPNDDNRGLDGKHLREEYAETTEFYPYDALDGPCSMFEMLIGLARRCEDIMEGPNTTYTAYTWFWEMMHNVGLDRFTNDEYINSGDVRVIDEILNTILERTYKRSGKGGLFPLKETKKDQRKVELWYQMSAYLLENYF